MTELEVGIVTANIEELTAFYRDAFGFEQHAGYTFAEGEVRRFGLGVARLKVFQPADPPTASRPSELAAQAGFAYAALLVADAAEVAGAVVRAGGTLLVPVTAHRPGACFAMVADPQGNRWELLQEDPA